MTGSPPALTDGDYRRLLEFRDGLRRFLHWSENEAAAVGLTSAQHQLLLAIRGHPGPLPPTISDVADHLMVRHHSAVGLVNRAEASGLVERRMDQRDQRLVRLVLTTAGEDRLVRLSIAHIQELHRLAPALDSLRTPDGDR